jgi:hypothetical protein
MPDLSSPQRDNLAWLMSGLHEAEHVHLSKIAERRVGSASLESKTKQVRRLLKNEAIDTQALQKPLAGRLLRAAAASQERIRILMDTVELSGDRQILMAALAYRRRALPLRWQVRRRTGVSGAEAQISLLRALSGQIPEDTEVVVVGSGGAFHSTDLMSYITARGWHFRLRLHSDTYVRLAGENRWHELRELAPEEGERRYLQGAELAKDKRYGPVNLALCRERGEDDPWLIATDQRAGRQALRTYERRMWTQGQLFADFEDGGFHLNRSRIYHTDRLSRLVMALSWVYTWLMHVGAWVVKRGLRHKVDRTDRRDRSYVEIGRRWLRRCVTNGDPLRVRLKPYF